MPLRLLRRRRLVLASALVLTFLVCLCLPSIAHAQSIGLFQETSLPRVGADGATLKKRDQALKPEGVNYQDCVDDQRIRFPLQVSGLEGNASLQVWAGLGGADCKVQTNRTGINAVCWPLVTGVPLQVNPIVDIPVRAIMAGAGLNKPAEPISDQSVCGTVDLTQISVQFLYFSPGQLATPSQSKEVAVEIDTIGPAPPTGLRLKPGNTRLRVEWDNISGEGGISVLTGIRAYCDVSSSAAATPVDADAAVPTDASCTEVPNDAGDSDSGLDAGTTTVCEDAGASSSSEGSDPACSTENLKSGLIPDKAFNEKYQCGAFFGNSGTSLLAGALRGEPLQNNTTYAVSVAATDAFNNVGSLSTPICQYPEVTTDFWENYVNAGGTAGGGLCTTSSPGVPIGSVSALGAIGIAVISAARRRYKSRSSSRRDR